MTLRRIATVEDLHSYLHIAMQLEHATIPPYLTALYSMHPTTNADAYRVIRVVAVEEMLHLTLAANLLNAVGGDTALAAEGFVPTYPAHLPDGETDFEVGTRAFSKETIATFLQIERPAVAEGEGRFVARDRSSRALLPAVDAHEDDLHFYSIGEFYAEIGDGIRRLHDEMGDALFCGDPARQVGPEYYYSGGGAITKVTDLDSAAEAMRTISEQGEGLGGAIFDEEGELAHYYRFEQLLLGRYYQPGDTGGSPTGPELAIDWDAVYPVKADAQLADYAEPGELRDAVLAYSTAYGEFLACLDQAFSGRPDLLVPAVGDMFHIKELASQIMRNPMPGEPGVNAAPVFRGPAPVEVS
ncbi:ferritin-like protein [Nocardioides sp. cx-173]|uniref:ferritin-like domain-containing protein n=1 Tax=Nocardioides sp. cx-173 TaxID=2898796 RepID=UPI001E50D804|nr:ferritin-like protein [Nocardioides sp. cx-173]MCD4526642.1 ferritin-like protein [Nocardioides sp. cx-173]UGB40735.1 ferritin-like protein [Nocardioides sp. cx-173]